MLGELFSLVLRMGKIQQTSGQGHEVITSQQEAHLPYALGLWLLALVFL